jgi:CBS domain containing-hemolysin-like protein
MEIKVLESGLKPLLLILAALALIGLNALWVAAEFAIVRVRRTRLEELAGQGVEAAKSAIVVVDGISDYLALTQIGITVASLAVGWLAEAAVVQLLRLVYPAVGHVSEPFHAVAIATAFLVVTVLHVVLGEQVPKLLAVRSAERYLLLLAPPLRIVHFMMRPFLRILERASAWILRLMGHGIVTHAPLTEDELKLILAESHKGGIVSDGEAEIIVRAFEFADKQAEEIMIPAEKVSYISLERTLQQNLAAARAHMHARLPVCISGLDSVIGTVSMKDVWPVLEHEQSNAAFERACRRAIIIPIDFSQEDILKAFRDARGQIGIVRDRANGKTLGIVTLEDVLESLVGDVREAKPSVVVNQASKQSQ